MLTPLALKVFHRSEINSEHLGAQVFAFRCEEQRRKEDLRRKKVPAERLWVEVRRLPIGIPPPGWRVFDYWSATPTRGFA